MGGGDLAAACLVKSGYRKLTHYPLFCRFGRTAVPRYNVKLPRDLATPRLSLLVQDVAQTGRDRMEIQ
jgi:hypothetical protein